MRFLYTIGIALYGFSIRLASLFNDKAAKFVAGRKHWSRPLKSVRDPRDKWVWFHCASLGEFEQGRPVIEMLRAQRPELKILLTFFSPSGYEIRKDYKGADHVCYLPLDLKYNVRAFLDILKPEFAVFIKYEIWVNYLFEMKERKTPVWLVSAHAGADSGFFRFPFAGLYREAFLCFRGITTQTEASAEILKNFTGHKHIVTTGDTRFDRVLNIRDTFSPIPEIEKFCDGNFCVVAGSTWPADEELLSGLIEKTRKLPVKWILVPHEIHKEKIMKRVMASHGEMIAFSKADTLNSGHRVLWIDNIGMLSRLYNYGDIAYIGGGFDKGIHNTLEAAVYGCPVAFGPKHEKFNEAVELVSTGGGFCVRNETELHSFFEKFFSNPELLLETKNLNRKWAESHAGASENVLKLIISSQV